MRSDHGQFALALTPTARRSDPESSHLAGEGVTRSGTRADQQHQVLTLIRRHPGSTSKELAGHALRDGIRLDRFQIARRCPELIPIHVHDPKTHATHQPGKELRWWPVER